VCFPGLDEQERSFAELDRFSFDESLSGSGHDEEPLIGPAMPNVGPTLDFPRCQRHLGVLRTPVSEDDAEPVSKLEVPVLHQRSSSAE
jgi:hypothetical protein